MTKLVTFFFVAVSLSVVAPIVARAESNSNEPKLVITNGSKVTTISRAQLLKYKSLRSLEVKNDVSYHRTMLYKHAVPAQDVFKGLALDPSMTLSFKCLDGFSAPIDQNRLFNRDKNNAIAYIAIEDPKNKWPQVKKASPESAGPFYLVWENPDKSNIGIEEWPYQLSGFIVSQKTVEEQFPNVSPAKELAAEDPVRKGYASFMKNCFACHAMNGDGVEKMGPDLNLPESPTDYFKRDYFLKLVRNPQSLRHWPKAQMSKTDPALLPDSEIADIWLYLEHMAKRKKK